MSGGEGSLTQCQWSSHSVLFDCSYENEMLKKAELENEFILNKKVNGFFSHVSTF